jgi:hypothetical protein
MLEMSHCGATTFSIMTFSIMILSITVHRTIKLSKAISKTRHLSKMTISVMLLVIVRSAIMLNVILLGVPLFNCYAECRCAE